MNGNGCLMQLMVVLTVLFGGVALGSSAIENVIEPESEIVIVVTEDVPTRFPTNTMIPVSPTFTALPTNTATVTATLTPENTATSTATLTPEDTATNTETSTPEDTATNTATFTPTFTPTPATLCELRVNRILDVNVRVESNASSPLVVQLPNNTNMDVYDQEIGFDNFIWFFIEATLDGETYEGWVRSDLIEQVTPCPPLD